MCAHALVKRALAPLVPGPTPICMRLYLIYKPYVERVAKNSLKILILTWIIVSVVADDEAEREPKMNFVCACWAKRKEWFQFNIRINRYLNRFGPLCHELSDDGRLTNNWNLPFAWSTAWHFPTLIFIIFCAFSSSRFLRRKSDNLP